MSGICSPAAPSRIVGRATQAVEASHEHSRNHRAQGLPAGRGLCKQFYIDAGFTLSWSSEVMAQLHAGSAAFLLQDFYVKEFAENLMMHLLVPDVEAWWRHISAQDLPGRYGVMLQPPEDRDWGIRDFVMNDPSGVLWRIGQSIEP